MEYTEKDLVKIAKREKIIRRETIWWWIRFRESIFR